MVALTALPDSTALERAGPSTLAAAAAAAVLADYRDTGAAERTVGRVVEARFRFTQRAFVLPGMRFIARDQSGISGAGVLLHVALVGAEC